MKKISLILLLTALVLMLPGLPAAAAPTEEEVCAIIEDIYQQHLARHDFKILSAGSAEGDDPTQGLVFSCPPGDAYTILACAELQLAEGMEMSTASRDVFAHLSTALEAANAISEAFDGLAPFNAYKYNTLYGGNVRANLLSTNWWTKGECDAYTVYTGPAVFVDGSGEVIDDTYYALTIFFEPDLTRIWVLSDADLVHDLFRRLDITTAKSNKQGQQFIQWLEEMDAYTDGADGIPPRGPAAAEKKQADALAWIESLDILGTVTIVHTGNVNLREDDGTDSAIVAKAKPGETFECVAITDSGWYQVIYGMRTVFVSQKMSEIALR